MNVQGKVIVSPAPRADGPGIRALSGRAWRPHRGRRHQRLRATLDLVKAERGNAVDTKVDVASAASAMELARTALEAFGRIDALVNNAALYGSLKGGRFDAISKADWDAAMAVNVKGIWNCCKAAVPAMRQGGGGSIVNIASLAATYGMPYGLHYTTSKAAVDRADPRTCARTRPRQDRVNAIAPSAVVTEGTREFFAEKTDKALDCIQLNQAIARNLESSDLVGTVQWLVSDASPLVTGQTIAVDGGTVVVEEHVDRLEVDRQARAGHRRQQGLGLAVAQALAAEGCRLELAAHGVPALAQAAETLSRTAPDIEVRAHPVDLARLEDRSGWPRPVQASTSWSTHARSNPGSDLDHASDPV